MAFIQLYILAGCLLLCYISTKARYRKVYNKRTTAQCVVLMMFFILTLPAAFLIGIVEGILGYFSRK